MLSQVLNSYCRHFSLRIHLFLTIGLSLSFFLGITENVSKLKSSGLIISFLVWFVILLNFTLFALNGTLVYRNFTKSVEKIVSSEMPIDSLEGFSDTKKTIAFMLHSSYSVLGTAILSFLIFIGVVISTNILEMKNISWIRNAILIIVIGLLIVALANGYLIDAPEAPPVVPGGLIGYYIPRSLPSTLDNILADTLYPFLDPITRLRFDEWTQTIEKSLKPTYEDNKEQLIRVERAREKILLMAYLRLRMPSIITNEVYRDELNEIMETQALDEFIKGSQSGLSLELLEEVISRLQQFVPEVFDTIDRLMIDLLENLAQFKEKEFYALVKLPPSIYGRQTPFRVFLFMLNKSPDFKTTRRPVQILVEGEKFVITPKKVASKIYLDRSRLDILSDKLEISQDTGEDVLRVLSRILQVGDAYWLQFLPRTYGETIINVSVNEEGKGQIFGQTNVISLKRDVRFFTKTYGGRVGILGGLLAPLGNLMWGILIL